MIMEVVEESTGVRFEKNTANSNVDWHVNVDRCSSHARFSGQLSVRVFDFCGCLKHPVSSSTRLRLGSGGMYRSKLSGILIGKNNGIPPLKSPVSG